MNREDICNKLGIPLVKDEKDLKIQWRKLMLKYHPDRNKEPNAEKTFINIQKLFELLEKSFNAIPVTRPTIIIRSRPFYYSNGNTTSTGPSFTWTFSG